MTPTFTARYLSAASFPARLALVQEMSAEMERLRAIEILLPEIIDAIENAIYCDDGLDGLKGERLLQKINLSARVNAPPDEAGGRE